LVSLVKDTCDGLEPNVSSHLVNTAKGETYECKETFEAAKLAAAATVTGLKKILDGDYERGYAIVRPPGHHAYHNKAAGFCFFNNVAIAAKVALIEPYNLKKVCIFDWDIHHGDGTQSIFYEDDRVLFISLHRTDKLTFYPAYKDCLPEYTGSGKGAGFNVNVAWETGLIVDEFDRLNNKQSDLGN